MLDSGLYLKAKLNLAPQMRYALQILQMPAEELTALVQEQAMENPLISLDTVAFSSRSRESWERIPENFSAPSLDRSLRTALRSQIPLSLPQEIQWTLLQLIDSLDESGYLRDPHEKLIELLGIPPSLFEESLALFQSFDPPGVGAFSLSECLSLQLCRIGGSALELRVARNHLEDVAAGRLAKIAREEQVPLSQVRAAVRRLHTLSPYPASGYDTGNSARYVTPDITVTRRGSELEIVLNEQLSPKLNVDPFYLDLMSRSNEEELGRYLRRQMDSLSQLEASIAMRTRTLRAVTRAIVEVQSRFFLTGDPALCPLSMEDVSRQVDLHISTVSRAVQNKYLLCEWGVFPLRHFFARYAPDSPRNSGEPATVSSIQIQCMIQEMIQAESPTAPLSDQQLVRLLDQKGISISRRAVAKYRQKMGIPGTYARKKA